jgi:hypothetical protein
LVCVLPLAVSGLSRVNWKRLGPGLIGVLVLVFVLAFTGSAVHKVVRDFKNTAPHWGKIKYSERRRHISSNRHIPRDATVILLGYPNTKDYYFFGEDYTRRVIQWPESLTKQSLNHLQAVYPDAYIYLDPKRCSHSFNNYARQVIQEKNPSFQYLRGKCEPVFVLCQSQIIDEIDWSHEGKLFLIRGEIPDL